MFGVAGWDMFDHKECVSVQEGQEEGEEEGGEGGEEWPWEGSLIYYRYFVDCLINVVFDASGLC